MDAPKPVRGELDRLRLALADALAREPGAAERVGRVCVSALPGDGAVVSLITGTQVWETLAAANDLVAQLDEVQYSLGEGPSWDAFTSGRAVLVPNLATAGARRWPAFAEAVTDLGIGAVFALPLQVGAITLGVCAVCRHTAGQLSADELKMAFAVTDLAAAALIGLGNPGSLDDLDTQAPEWLNDASADRRQVHQATGMLISYLGLSPEAAFARLRAHAFSTGRLVGDVAAEIVAGTLRLDTDPP